MNGQNSRNIMNNFLIFGDSYGDPKNKPDLRSALNSFLNSLPKAVSNLYA